MRYKYIGSFIGYDGLNRSVQITTDVSPSQGVLPITLSGLKIELDEDNDVFRPIRAKRGKMSIVYDGSDEIIGLMQELIPQSATQYSVVVNRTTANGTYTEFIGYLSGETRSQNAPEIGESFDLEFVSRLGVAGSVPFILDDNTMMMPYTRRLDYFACDALKMIGFYGSNMMILPGNLANQPGEPIVQNDTPYTSLITNVASFYYPSKNSQSGVIETGDERGDVKCFCADVLNKIATTYGFTWQEEGLNVYGIAPDCGTSNYLGTVIDSYDHNYSQVSINTYDVNGVTLHDATIDYNLPPKKLTVTCEKEGISSVDYVDSDYLQSSENTYDAFPTNSQIQVKAYASETGDGLCKAMGSWSFMVRDEGAIVDVKSNYDDLQDGTYLAYNNTIGIPKDSLVLIFRCKSKMYARKPVHRIKIYMDLVIKIGDEYYNYKAFTDKYGAIRLRYKAGGIDKSLGFLLSSKEDEAKTGTAFLADHVECAMTTWSNDLFVTEDTFYVELDINKDTIADHIQILMSTPVLTWDVLGDSPETYEYVHHTRSIGEDYSYESGLAYNVGGKDVATNQVYSTNNNYQPQLAKMMLRVQQQKCRSYRTLRLTMEQNSINDAQILYLDGETYMVTGLSRDYMRGEERVTMTHVVM